MDIIIQYLGFTGGEGIENYIREKLNTLRQDNIVRANVTLFLGPSSEPESCYCEIRLEAPGNDPFVKRKATSFELSITECIDVLVETMNREKSKQNARRQGDAHAIQEAISQAETDLDPDLEDVVR